MPIYALSCQYQHVFNEELLVNKVEGCWVHYPGQNGQLAVEGQPWEGHYFRLLELRVATVENNF